MDSLSGLDLADVSSIADRRDEVVAAVADHAGRLAYDLARLDGGDYGRRSFATDAGEWTVKYEAGDLEFLLFEPRSGPDTYVVSTKAAPDAEALAKALADYDAFVAAYNEYVESLDDVLDGVLDDAGGEGGDGDGAGGDGADGDGAGGDGVDGAGAFPEPASTDAVVAERDRVVGLIESCCARMAGELRRAEGGDYGTFGARVDAVRWELKWDADGAAYLRVGGSDGVYLLSQYGPPSALDVREYAPQFGGFVDAYNDHVDELGGDLESIDLAG